MLNKIVTLLTGNAAAQAVNTLTILWIVASYIPPAQFGIYAVVMSYIGILSAVICLRYEIAIVAVKTNDQAVELVKLCLVIASLACLGVWLITVALEAVASRSVLHGVPVLLFTLVLIFKALNQVFAGVLYRQEKYRFYSIVKMIQALALLGGFWLSGTREWGATGLLLATLVSYVSFVLLVLPTILRLPGIMRVQFGSLRDVAREQSDFVKFNTPQALLDNVLSNGVVVMLNALSGAAITGYYSFMQRILRAPLGLIFGAMSQVVFRFVSLNVNAPTVVRREVVRVMWITLCILAIAAIGVALVYWQFDQLGFLSKWSALRPYIPAFAAWMLVPFLFAPFATLPIVYGRQRAFFVYATGFNVISLLVLTFLVRATSPTTAFFVTALLSIGYFTAIGVWVRQLPAKYAPA